MKATKKTAGTSQAAETFRFKETALDPNHEHYWGCKKLNKKTIILRCQVCGKEEKRKIDLSKVPSGEVPEIS